jgi:hypothetical protein
MVGIENGKFYTWVQYIVLNLYVKLEDEGFHIAHLNLILRGCECTGQGVHSQKWKGPIQIKVILMRRNPSGWAGHHESWPVQGGETLVVAN